MPAPDGGPTREETAEALFALIDKCDLIQWRSRRATLWPNIPTKPAICQLAFDEVFIPKPGGPTQRVWNFEWWIYHEAGLDPNAIPSTTTNAILEQVEAALGPQPGDEGLDRANLQGTVHSLSIVGTILKVDGDIEGQALIIVPIQIVAP